MSEPNQDYWRAQARRYDRATLALNRRFPQMARAVAEAARGEERALEIAAGSGLVTRELAPAVGQLVATDASPAMLELLQGRMADSANVEIREADALALSFDDGTFDVVVIGNLLHLLPEPTAALAEARRVLKSGGLLLAPTFCHGQGALAQVVSRLLGLTGFPIVTRFRDRELDGLIEGAGFQSLDARWFQGLLPIRFVAARAR